MKRYNRYVPYIAMMFYLTGCARFNEWRERGDINNLPEEQRRYWENQQRQWLEERARDKWRWIEEERNRR